MAWQNSPCCPKRNVWFLQVKCTECQDLLQVPPSSSRMYSFLHNIDLGGLKYPSPSTVWLCKVVCRFVEEAMKSPNVRRSHHIVSHLMDVILPHLKSCSAMQCRLRSADHSDLLCRIFLTKLLRPLLVNWAGNLTASVEKVVRYIHKPLSRKFLRLWFCWDPFVSCFVPKFCL